MPNPDIRPDKPHSAAWHRQPVLWLGVLVFIASLLGCIQMIVLGGQQADIPLETGRTILGMPAPATTAPSPSPSP